MQFKIGLVSDAKAGYAKVYFKDDDITTDWWPVVVRTSLKDKESWILNANEHVVCVTDEHCEEGTILGAIHSDAEPPDVGADKNKFRKVFEDGTVLEYDKAAHTLTATVKGGIVINTENDVQISTKANASIQCKSLKATCESVEVTASESANITSPAINVKGNTTITGNLSIVGNLSFSGSLSGAGGAISMDGNEMKVPKLTASGDVKAGSISLLQHKHGGVQSGGSSTTPPTP